VFSASAATVPLRRQFGQEVLHTLVVQVRTPYQAAPHELFGLKQVFMQAQSTAEVPSFGRQFRSTQS
jgi:hypothetical protein